jgi:hypothetical protein
MRMDFIGDIDLVGLLSVVIFYLLILGVGMWAAGKKSHVEGVSEEVGTISSFKGTVSRDFLLRVFFHASSSLSPRK